MNSIFLKELVSSSLIKAVYIGENARTSCVSPRVKNRTCSSLYGLTRKLKTISSILMQGMGTLYRIIHKVREVFKIFS
jgi:putative exporter of polyketide antibiotics